MEAQAELSGSEGGEESNTNDNLGVNNSSCDAPSRNEENTSESNGEQINLGRRGLKVGKNENSTSNYGDEEDEEDDVDEDEDDEDDDDVGEDGEGDEDEDDDGEGDDDDDDGADDDEDGADDDEDGDE